MMAKERNKKIHKGEKPRIKCVEIVNEAGMTKKYVMNRIQRLFNKTSQHGVVLHYIGPGRRGTGDWCFSEGFISFKDIVDLYMQHLKGKSLHLISDCSYSGHWVDCCMEFLDDKRVQPCGHSAMKKGIKIKVYCSCQPDEIGYSLLCTARGFGNDKNTGLPYLKKPEEIEEKAPDQTVCDKDFTDITCGKLPAEECALPLNFTYLEKTKRSRIELTQDDDGEYPVWRYVIPQADLHATATFRDMAPRLQGTRKNTESKLKVPLISGLGKEPPQAIKDWVTRVMNGLEDLLSFH